MCIRDRLEFACLLGIPPLFAEIDVLDEGCLLLVFGLFELILGHSLLIGAPTSSGVFFTLGLFKFFLGKLLLSFLFDN